MELAILYFKISTLCTVIPWRRDGFILRLFCHYGRYILQIVSSKDLAFNKFNYLVKSSKGMRKLHYITLMPLSKMKILQDLEQAIWLLVTTLLLGKKKKNATLKTYLKISGLSFLHMLNEVYSNLTQLTEGGDDNQKTDLKPFESIKTIFQQSETRKIILVSI